MDNIKPLKKVESKNESNFKARVRKAAREPEAKAKEEKKYLILSNQSRKERSNNNVSQETKMSGAKARESRKE
ncbi:hypothetical protein [Companilactobacillus furfuricola]|uniref:hypothetical protein n=1 Tax=Companilactobacillus furfuricola TaxID=1462575 RepID=UPI000F7ADC8F|nr:hypothetical protein [Companilactobacillus furfuricola]